MRYRVLKILVRISHLRSDFTRAVSSGRRATSGDSGAVWDTVDTVTVWSGLVMCTVLTSNIQSKTGIQVPLERHEDLTPYWTLELVLSVWVEVIFSRR